jgi:hypothetical protein
MQPAASRRCSRCSSTPSASTVLTGPSSRYQPSMTTSTCRPSSASSINSFTWSGASQNGGVVNGMFCNGGTNLYTGIINFKSTGNVGIGTTSPLSLLEVDNVSGKVWVGWTPQTQLLSVQPASNVAASLNVTSSLADDNGNTHCLSLLGTGSGVASTPITYR